MPVDSSGDRDDHSPRHDMRGDERTDVVDPDRLDVGTDSLGGHAEGVRVVKLTER